MPTEKYRGLLDVAPIGAIEVELRPAGAGEPPAVRVVAVNPAAIRMFGAAAAEELLGWLRAKARSDDDATRAARAELAALTEQPDPQPRELDLAVLQGRRLHAAVTASAFEPDAAGVRPAVVWVADIGERRSLERQMHAAQRLEAIARLAGGVAHDFNNALSVIASYASLLRGEAAGAQQSEDAQAILDAVARASELTRQLMLFARRQPAERTIVNVGAVVRGLHRLLERLLGEDIELTLRLGEGALVQADRTQIEQVLMNLAVNARDAMPRGGPLTIEAHAQEIADHDPRVRDGAQPGSWIRLAVSDAGVGMDAATRARLFEPLFTTKEDGRGSGLGLATVEGIVRQSGGLVRIDSDVGRGTTVEVLLPAYQDARAITGRVAVASGGGGETLLLVEDQELVRRATRRILERGGYQVVEARNGTEAVAVWRSEQARISLVVTDVVMPDMSGRELVELCDSAPALFVSGYLEDPGGRLSLPDGAAYLSKPYNPDVLLVKVREVLDLHAVK